MKKFLKDNKEQIVDHINKTALRQIESILETVPEAPGRTQKIIEKLQNSASDEETGVNFEIGLKACVSIENDLISVQVDFNPVNLKALGKTAAEKESVIINQESFLDYEEFQPSSVEV